MTTSGGVATRGGLAASGEYRWVYLWSWPIRAMHWIAAISLVTLALTGFFIGRPYFMAGGEAGSPYVMGTVRFVHYVAAALLVMTGIVRLYWLFAGNKFERWRALFPVMPKDIRNLLRQMKHYAMLDKHGQEPHYLGHNPLQQFSYTGIYFLALLEIVTGFALYGQSNPGGFFFTVFGWLGPLFGGMQVLRFVHHVTSWAFLIFIPIHVYLATRADVLERAGSISSIITGGRFVAAKQRFVDE